MLQQDYTTDGDCAAKGLAVVAATLAGALLALPVISSAAPASLAAYDFDASSGITLPDRSGNNHSGTLVNGPVWASGKYGGGLTFDGVNDYVSSGDVTQADGLTSVTVSAWVKFAVAGGGGAETHFVDKSQCSGQANGGPWELGATFTAAHKAEFVLYPQNGSPSLIVFSGASTASVDDGAWHHITGRYDGAQISIWVDGNLENSRSAPGLRMSSTSYGVELGGHCNGYAYPFKGTLDDVRIYARALTPAEIQQDMATPVGGGSSPSPPADTTAPSTPTGLTSSSVTSSQATLSWQASNDNVGVGGYRVYRNGTVAGTTSSTSYASTGLAANTTYAFTVAAFDAAGNSSAQSAQHSVTTSPSSSPSATGTAPLSSYDFDAGSGTTLADRSGNHPGALNNGPTWTSGRYNGGLAFDGTDDFVGFGDVAEADGLTRITVSAWMKFTVAGAGNVETHLVDKSLCSGDVNGGPWELGVTLSNAHKAEFVIYPQGGNPGAMAASGPSITSVDDGAWHHLTGRYDGSTVSIWVDGNLESSTSAPGLTTSSTSYGISFAGNCNGNAYRFRGTMDDVRIYARALTAGEIANDLATPVGNGSSPAPPPADTAAPSTPTNLSSSGTTSSQTSVSWQASTDNVGVTGYRVYRDGALAGTVASTSFTNAGLAPNTSYTFTAAAFDAAGNSSPPSAPTAVTTSTSGASASYTTAFNSNENPLSEGGAWHRASNVWTNVQTVGGVAFGTNGPADTYDDSYALLSGFGPNQSAEAVIYRDESLTPGRSHEVELLLRGADDANSIRGYECLFNYLGGIEIVRWNGPFANFTYLTIYDHVGLGRPLRTGDVVKATMIGTEIRLYINGTLMGRANDSTFSSGQPGIAFFVRPDGSQRLLGLTSYTVTSP